MVGGRNIASKYDNDNKKFIGLYLKLYVLAYFLVGFWQVVLSKSCKSPSKKGEILVEA